MLLVSADYFKKHNNHDLCLVNFELHGSHNRSGLILGLRPANERRRYKVTPSLIGWAQT